MPSPLNMPAPSFAIVASPAAAAETVIATSPKLIVDTPQYAVLLTALVDITIGTSGTAVTFKLRRGTTTGGTAVVNGATWGPYAVTATDEYQFALVGSDTPPASSGLQYCLTVTVTGGAATSTVNVVCLSAEVAAFT
jgi:hypothetical protein